jgi:hypothetical protein
VNQRSVFISGMFGKTGDVYNALCAKGDKCNNVVDREMDGVLLSL